MILNIFTVYDSKAEAYLQPFFMKSKGEAVRAFTDIVNDGTSQFNKHPSDYTLFHVGAYDDGDSSFVILPTPVSLGLAIEYMKQGRMDFLSSSNDSVDTDGLITG